MKKASYFYIIIFCIAAIISIIYYTFSPKFNNGNNREPPVKNEYAPLDTVEGAHKEPEKYAAAKSKNFAYVTDSAIAGYMLKSDENCVNLFEIYENGYQEKIKSLEINPKFLRKIDQEALESGIKRKSYEEICSLIEDFSS